MNGIIDLQNGCTDEHTFLDQVAHSLDSPIGHNQILGPTVEELFLNLYALQQLDRMPSNLNSVISIISKCQNLKSLHLLALVNDGAEIDGLNFFAYSESNLPITSILENLKELSLTSKNDVYSVDQGPIIQFKQLKSLNLDGIDIINPELWIQLMETVENTLTSLRIDGITDTDISYFPFPMPKLRSFSFDGRIELQISHLYNCPHLTDVQTFYFSSANFIDTDFLKPLNANVSISIEAWDVNGDILRAAVGSRFKITAAVLWCRNAFGYDEAIVGMPYERYYQSKTNDFLAFFNDRQRASRVRTINLDGPIDKTVLDMVFMNCSNVESLLIDDCASLNNDYLINRAMNGRKLSKLRIWKCQQITDEGLIPLIISSGEYLTKFEFIPIDGNPWPDEGLWNTLAHSSPCLKYVGNCIDDEDIKKNFWRREIVHLF